MVIWTYCNRFVGAHGSDCGFLASSTKQQHNKSLQPPLSCAGAKPEFTMQAGKPQKKVWFSSTPIILMLFRSSLFQGISVLVQGLLHQEKPGLHFQSIKISQFLDFGQVPTPVPPLRSMLNLHLSVDLSTMHSFTHLKVQALRVPLSPNSQPKIGF